MNLCLCTSFRLSSLGPTGSLLLPCRRARRRPPARTHIFHIKFITIKRWQENVHTFGRPTEREISLVALESCCPLSAEICGRETKKNVHTTCSLTCFCDIIWIGLYFANICHAFWSLSPDHLDSLVAMGPHPDSTFTWTTRKAPFVMNSHKIS